MTGRIIDAISKFQSSLADLGLDQPSRIVLRSDKEWLRLWGELQAVQRFGAHYGEDENGLPLTSLYVNGAEITCPAIERHRELDLRQQGREEAWQGLAALAHEEERAEA